MSTFGRNDACPCGSRKKYKKCCLASHEAAEARRQAAQDLPSLESYSAMLEEDDLDELSNGVLDLIDEGRLDAAEARARDLLRRYPDVIDGLDRLARVHEARGDRVQAAQYHRRAATFADTHAGYDPERAVDHRAKAARLEGG